MNQKDQYDIIIENLTKEWEVSSMINNGQEQWEVPKYSKRQINKAGTTISNLNISKLEKSKALDVLNNWRSSHAYPLQEITNDLRIHNPDAIVVQRLKRLESITNKLIRFPTMNLYRMQDLGGCRVIVNSIEEVYYALDQYKNSNIPHILKRENDYIQNPKESGYRSYHMVYQFKCDTEAYNKNMLIEIQFRTKIQHVWATAVEIMGVYTKSQLKASIGDKDILRFFALVSSVFAIIDKTPIVPNTGNSIIELIDEIKEIDNKLKIVSRLSALSTAINLTEKDGKIKQDGYFLLRLNHKERRLKVTSFSKRQIELATKAYNEIEESDDPYIDVVLVAATSFNSLKIAYPNYFTDISGFIDVIAKIYSNFSIDR